MTIEQVDRETAAAARKAAATFQLLATQAYARNETKEWSRLSDEADWHKRLADRLESKYDDEE